MSVDIMEGQWQQLRGKIREKWSKLTDDDLGQLGGGYDQLVGLLQAKYGYARDRAQHEVDKFLKAMKAR
ncbi:MAG TPA: CsbD family protein [Anaerolineae bacterium]|nr:CsbD family protein [Anaerolineae bacterium]